MGAIGRVFFFADSELRVASFGQRKCRGDPALRSHLGHSHRPSAAWVQADSDGLVMERLAWCQCRCYRAQPSDADRGDSTGPTVRNARFALTPPTVISIS